MEVAPLTASIVEVTGACTNCGRYGLLGNGLCVRCWDEKVWQMPRMVRSIQQNIKPCPLCNDSVEVVKIGFTQHGSQRLYCKACRRSFV